jgi:hypothetical protein
MNKEDRKKARKIMAHINLPEEMQRKLEEEDQITQSKIAQHMREVK